MCRIRLGYQFTYLYAALALTDGRLIAQLLQDLTAESFSLFLQFVEAPVMELYKHGKVLLALDRHQSIKAG